MKLAHDMTLDRLYHREGLIAVDTHFLEYLQARDATLCAALIVARGDAAVLDAKQESELLLTLAPHVEDFISQLFGIEVEAQSLAREHHALAPLYLCKRQFIQRRVAKQAVPEAFETLPAPAFDRDDKDAVVAWELAFATRALAVLGDAARSEELAEAEAYARFAMHHEEGRARHRYGILFHLPKKIDMEQLVTAKPIAAHGLMMLAAEEGDHRPREGFALTDQGGSLAEALDEAHYCIFCAHQGRDSCSKGLRDKDGAFKTNEHNVTLAGCPLEEKISEMHELKSQGYAIGALAVVCVDNPMVAGTGHRICNDCMKSCIYQKQDPVNIPLAETRVLDDVLELPYGYEIYSLLTRWNPLHVKRPYPKVASRKRVLIAGLGPAGYTLAHHLMQDGHTVVGIDGLKIEPLAQEISGVDSDGARHAFDAIQNVGVLYESLDTRKAYGFGGVAEYGITVRWNKNYLKLIRLLLERRDAFRMFGGVRFGSTLTVEGAFAVGFDHIALCLGAGQPRLLDIPNGMARGVRTASDFLMALQLTGAARTSSIANLQLRLPVVVVGAGLTAIDAATEALAYYPVQVEKFLSRYEWLCQKQGEQAVRRTWGVEETIIAEEFISHARQFREEKIAAAHEQRAPRLTALVHQFGGVHVLYRKRLQDAPSYRSNHEEVEKAFAEGIRFAEYLTPVEVRLDGFNHAETLVCDYAPPHESVTRIAIAARSILIAAGTQPNTVLAREDAPHFALDGKYFQAVDDAGNCVVPELTAKPETPELLTYVAGDGRAVSFFGDLHPSYAGNVVKAMASAKQGYPGISRILARLAAPPHATTDASFFTTIHHLLSARVHAVTRLTPNIVEVVIQAPQAALRFEPGQFYRLQNMEAYARKTEASGFGFQATKDSALSTSFAMEGLAMTGAWVDKAAGLISVIVLEMGGSSNLCASLQVGEPVVLMGPTGTPTEIPKGETVLLIGGGLGNAVLFSIGKAFRAAGSKVLYFAGYKKAIDRYKVEEIESAADVVVWCCDEAAEFIPSRPQDRFFHGNMVEALVAYGEDSRTRGLEDSHSQVFDSSSPRLTDISRIIAIGSDGMMRAVAEARHGVLKPYLNPNHVAIGSINSPMQCMMKEICAQCLQKHIDPKTGAETYVYSCTNQDQCLDVVSFAHLAERLKQNRVQELLTSSWLSACL